MGNITTKFTAESDKIDVGKRSPEMRFQESNGAFPNFQKLIVPTNNSGNFYQITANTAEPSLKKAGFFYSIPKDASQTEFSTLTSSSFLKNPWLKLTTELFPEHRVNITFNTASGTSPMTGLDSSLGTNREVSYSGAIATLGTPPGSLSVKLNVSNVSNTHPTVLEIKSAGGVAVEAIWIAPPQDKKIDQLRFTSVSDREASIRIPKGDSSQELAMGFSFIASPNAAFTVRPFNAEIQWYLEGSTTCGKIKNKVTAILDLG